MEEGQAELVDMLKDLFQQARPVEGSAAAMPGLAGSAPKPPAPPVPFESPAQPAKVGLAPILPPLPTAGGFRAPAPPPPTPLAAVPGPSSLPPPASATQLRRPAQGGSAATGDFWRPVTELTREIRNLRDIIREDIDQRREARSREPHRGLGPVKVGGNK